LVLNTRRAFNQNERSMESRFGNYDFIGNAQTLPRDVWESWDRETVRIQRDEMVLWDRMASRMGRPMPIGKMVHYFGKTSSNPEVVTSIDGQAKARRETATVTYEGAPIPIHSSAFGFGWRQVQAAATDGWDGLDMTLRDDTNRAVAEKLRDSLLAGDTSVVYGGAVQYGLRTAPGRNTRSTTNDLSTCTGAEWQADVKATLALNHADNFRVPMTLYVNWDDWFHASTTRYSASWGDTSIAQFIQQMEGVREVVPMPDLAADEMFAIVEDRRVCEVLIAMPMVTHPKFRPDPTSNYDFEVMAAASAIWKRDADGRMGLAHSS
jgi:hypothetical protein